MLARYIWSASFLGIIVLRDLTFPHKYYRAESEFLQHGYSVGSIAAGAGGRYPCKLCGRTVLYSYLRCSISILASNIALNISPFKNSSRILPLNDSIYPFSQGLPGSIKVVLTSNRLSCSPSFIAVNSLPLSERIYSGTPFYIPEETLKAAKLLRDSHTPCIIHQPSCSMMSLCI